MPTTMILPSMPSNKASVMPPRKRRSSRRPTHPFDLRVKPFVIQPFCIAPVLPGETLKNALFQIRAVTDPLASGNRLSGWHMETYWFYVKHRDMAGRDDYVDMMLDLNKDMSSYASTGKAEINSANSSIGIAWTQACYERVVETYFRDEGEAWNASGTTYTINSQTMAIVKYNRSSWLDSLIDRTDVDNVDVVVEDADADTNVEASEIATAMAQWQHLRQYGLTNMSYEDYLRTYGVRTARTELHIPELLRYTREWTYPTNTIDPSSGAASPAVSWSVRDRMDKDRYFSEPGFIFAVMVFRPKGLLANPAGNMVEWLNDAQAWLPALLADDHESSWKEFAAGTGPLPSNTDAYLVDMKDLFIHGDSFTNYSTGGAPAWSLPTAAGNKSYVPYADVEGAGTQVIFASDTGNWCYANGVVDFNIHGSQKDTSSSTT